MIPAIQPHARAEPWDVAGWRTTVNVVSERRMGYSLWALTWANAIRSPNRPSEEGNTSNWNEICLDREEMSNLMDRKPNGWQRADPEEEEANKVTSVGARAWDAVVKCVEGRPLTRAVIYLAAKNIWWTHDGSDHQGDTIAPDPALNAVPDARHRYHGQRNQSNGRDLDAYLLD